MTSQLKHCPFCGGAARLRPATMMGRKLIYVCCSHCGSMGRGKPWGIIAGGGADYIPKEEAIKAAINEWNQIVEEMLQ